MQKSPRRRTRAQLAFLNALRVLSLTFSVGRQKDPTSAQKPTPRISADVSIVRLYE